MPESLAVQRTGISTALTSVHEVLDTFASRDHTGEIFTAIRHFSAREAQWADFPPERTRTLLPLTPPTPPNHTVLAGNSIS